MIFHLRSKAVPGTLPARYTVHPTPSRFNLDDSDSILNLDRGTSLIRKDLHDGVGVAGAARVHRRQPARRRHLDRKHLRWFITRFRGLNTIFRVLNANFRVLHEGFRILNEDFSV